MIRMRWNLSIRITPWFFFLLFLKLILCFEYLWFLKKSVSVVVFWTVYSYMCVFLFLNPFRFVLVLKDIYVYVIRHLFRGCFRCSENLRSQNYSSEYVTSAATSHGTVSGTWAIPSYCLVFAYLFTFWWMCTKPNFIVRLRCGSVTVLQWMALVQSPPSAVTLLWISTFHFFPRLVWPWEKSSIQTDCWRMKLNRVIWREYGEWWNRFRLIWNLLMRCLIRDFSGKGWAFRRTRTVEFLEDRLWVVTKNKLVFRRRTVKVGGFMRDVVFY